MLSIVMPVLNNIEYTKSIIEQINKYTHIEWELIVINNGSIDGTEEYLEQCGLVDYWRNKDKNVGVTKAWNEGVEMCSGEYICIINNDIEIHNYFFDKLVAGFEEGIDYVVPRFMTENDINPRYFDEFINGFCFMFRKDKRVGPIDERLHIYFNDNWIWLKIKELGYRVKLIKDCVVYHHQSITSKIFQNKDIDIWNKICDENKRKFEQIEIKNNDIEQDLYFNLQ